MALQLWAIKDLECPPVNKCDASRSGFRIEPLKKAFEYGFQLCGDPKLLTLYKSDLIILISDLQKLKGFLFDRTLLGSVLGTLDDYIDMDLPAVFKDMIDNTYETSTDKYMPTRNMLHYLLIRIQRAVKLMTKVINDTLSLIIHIQDGLVKAKKHWRQILFERRIASMLHFQAKILILVAWKVYEIFQPLIDHFQNTADETAWLPQDYVFPDHLETWLNEPWLNEYIDIWKESESNQSGLTPLNLTDRFSHLTLH